MRPSIARANEQLDPRQQLAITPLHQSTTPCLHPVTIHQMALSERTSDCSLLLIYTDFYCFGIQYHGWTHYNYFQIVGCDSVLSNRTKVTLIWCITTFRYWSHDVHMGVITDNMRQTSNFVLFIDLHARI